MSSGQEATCDCARCVAHRGGTWDDVNGEAIRDVEQRRRDARADELDREIERLRAERSRL